MLQLISLVSREVETLGSHLDTKKCCIFKQYSFRRGDWDETDMDLALLGTDLSFFT